jgi:hypothetical protein
VWWVWVGWSCGAGNHEEVLSIARPIINHRDWNGVFPEWDVTAKLGIDLKVRLVSCRREVHESSQCYDLSPKRTRSFFDQAH